MKRILNTVLALATVVTGVHAQQYTKSGELILPKDFRQWTFLTSNTNMSYPEDGPAPNHPMFGNVFVQPDAEREFQKSGTWPDKTILLIELREMGNDSFVNKDARFQTAAMGYEVHVKDAAKGGWQFYFVQKDAATGKRFPADAKCFTCHQNHGAADTTFVQYYPTLIDAAKKHGTWKMEEPRTP